MADAEKKTISLKDHLATQGAMAAVFRATVEEDAPDAKVKVTPWSGECGCLCDFSFVLDASSIKELVGTDQVHRCCGKQLVVVEVTFADAYKAVAEVVMQQVSSYRKSLILDDLDSSCIGDCGASLNNCAKACNGNLKCIGKCKMKYDNCMKICNR